MVDVLADEGYQWTIVASHHLSRTCPTYFDHANPTGSYNIYSSPPNRADLLGPSPSSGWWYNMPNPGQGSWNVSPYAYQLQRVKYVNPSNGAEKTMIMVPSDDTLSYMAGYSGAQVGIIDSSIAPYASDPNRPVIVMPSTDGDNAWGGGFSSWMESTPGFFSGSQSAGYQITAVQDFVNAHGAAAPVVHVEDGAWIFPETDYGSPYFLKWIEPPLSPTNLPACYPGTKVDLETPGFALKFWSWAPVIAGANWCETAEQMLSDSGGSVQAWKIQCPYDWNGSYTSPNYAERAWHIYLGGLDSGFNYYGGLGNDDEVKQSLATRRAIEVLQSHLSTNLANDRTAPTVFKPQRFPWNPGAYTFGWFNSLPSGGTNSAYLKKMPSEFYVWTHAYDVSGITNLTLKVRLDSDGVNTLANNQNETYAGGSDVGSWISVSMTKRTLPNTQAALNAAASNGQIDYFPAALSPAIADYYFAKITDASVPAFRGKLLDYYIEATDARGNVSKSDIQHVFVENDGQGGALPSTVAFSSDPRDCAPLTVTYVANGGVLSNSTPVKLQIRFATNGAFTAYSMTHQGGGTSTYTVATVPDNAPLAVMYFQNDGETLTDNNSGANWSTSIRDCDSPVGPSSVTFSNAAACNPVTLVYFLNSGALAGATQVYAHIGYGSWAQVLSSQTMIKVSNNQWNWSGTPPQGFGQIDAVFHNDHGAWDNHGGLDWHFALNGCEPPVTPPGITITNPAGSISVGSEITVYSLEGLASEVVGLMSWTNSLNGAGGLLSVASPWSIANIPLDIGANVITVVGTNSGSATVTNAADSGSSSVYSDGWGDADNGGSGFGAWQFYTSSTDGNLNGRFMADSAAVNIGVPAWGLYANGTTNLSEAKRLLTNALAVGQTFWAQMDNGYIDPGCGVGVALQNGSGDTLWQFFFNGGDTNYNITGSTTDIGWTPNGISIEFTLTGPTTYVSRITPFGSSARTNAGVLNITNDMSITVFRAWNWHAGAGSDYDLYFNNLRLTTTDSGAGSTTSDTVTITRQSGTTDTDGDGIPDSWEQLHFNNPTSAVAGADSDGDGIINWEEFVGDTDPTWPASAFSNRIEQWVFGPQVATLQAGGATTNSRVYDVWVSTNLLEPTWLPVNLNVSGALNGAPVSLTITNQADIGYYRTGVKVP
ncbi:MAG: hypothetical protein BWK77_04265 [Verrucomicrobia bacterium A1]|nr:MAG: hypothetical protein BWK77_04265 [Verrucomicrobia bacterium A1]